MESGLKYENRKTTAIVCFLCIETRFDLIYYNTCFDIRVKSYNSLQFQPQLITSFSFELVNSSTFLSFFKNIVRSNTKIKITRKNTVQVRKATKWNPNRKIMTTKLKENTRLEGHNLILFLIFDLTKQKTIKGQIFIILKFKQYINKDR